MIPTIQDFIAWLLPEKEWSGARLHIDDTHTLDIAALDSGRLQFAYSVLVAGEHHLLSTVELERGKLFWHRVVEVAETFCGVVVEEGAALSALGLPGADLLTQEVAREMVPQKRAAKRVRAGASNPVFTGTVESSRGAGPRKSQTPLLKEVEVSHEEDDVTQFLGED